MCAAAEPQTLPQSTGVLGNWGILGNDPEVLTFGKSCSVVISKEKTICVVGNDDSDRTKSIGFYENRKLLGTKERGGKYQFHWQPTEPGLFTLKVVRLQTTGESYFLNKIDVTVLDRVPLAITSPQPSAELTNPTPIRFAAGKHKMKNLTFYANGKAVGSFGSDGLIWNVPVMPSGSYTVWLEGQSGEDWVRSDATKVTIPARVSLSKPETGENIVVDKEGSSVQFAANLHPSLQVERVEYLCNGSKVCESSQGSSEATWDVTNVESGPCELVAVLFDDAGHRYESAPAKLNIDNAYLRDKRDEASREEREAVLASQRAHEEAERERQREAEDAERTRIAFEKAATLKRMATIEAQFEKNLQTGRKQLLASLATGAKPEGSIKGTILYHHNRTIGNRADVGAEVYLLYPHVSFPEHFVSVEVEDTRFQLSSDTGKNWEVPILNHTLVGVDGNYELRYVPPGQYTVAVMSKQTKGGDDGSANNRDSQGRFTFLPVKVFPGLTAEASHNFGMTAY